MFAAILDARRGGDFALQPSIPFEASLRYLAGTNVLETTFITDRGSVRLVDAMTLPDERLGPMRELAGRRSCGDLRQRRRGHSHLGRGSAGMAWRHGGSGVRDAGRIAGAAHARERVRRAAGAARPRGGGAAPRKTIRFWQDWSAHREYEGPWRESVLRSALALKLLIFAPSGATTAAVTTSLPEEIGGTRNWDYRFCWIRDSNFLIDALLQLGCRGEARALFWWFMQATALTAPRLQVLYRLDGGPDAPEREVPTLGGYRGSRPVRVGNGAIDQRQLDIYGDLLETAWLYARGLHTIDRDTGIVLGRIADLVCDLWRQPDCGIWEVRSAPQHFTHSKVMCWVALDRAIRLAEEGDVPSRHSARWRREAAAVREFVETRCWSERRRSYTRAAGTDDLDASLLMLSKVGYGDPAGRRMQGTIDAVGRELRRGPFVYRYLSEDGLPGSEGCFLNCSFWLVTALARAGRLAEATDLMNDLVGQANDVGLYAEEVDPRSGAFLGNFPQALVHLSQIDAALAIDEVRRGDRRQELAAARS